MFSLKSNKSNINVIFYIKSYNKTSSIKNSNFFTKRFSQTSRVLYLRSPKHFKNGKQIIKKYIGVYTHTVTLSNIDSTIFSNNNVQVYYKHRLIANHSHLHYRLDIA